MKLEYLELIMRDRRYALLQLILEAKIREKRKASCLEKLMEWQEHSAELFIAKSAEPLWFSSLIEADEEMRSGENNE